MGKPQADRTRQGRAKVSVEPEREGRRRHDAYGASTVAGEAVDGGRRRRAQRADLARHVVEPSLGRIPSVASE